MAKGFCKVVARRLVAALLVALLVMLLVTGTAAAQSECQIPGCHYPIGDSRILIDWRTGECIANCDPQLLYDSGYGAWYYLYSDGSWSWY